MYCFQNINITIVLYWFYSYAPFLLTSSVKVTSAFIIHTTANKYSSISGGCGRWQCNNKLYGSRDQDDTDIRTNFHDYLSTAAIKDSNNGVDRTFRSQVCSIQSWNLAGMLNSKQMDNNGINGINNNDHFDGNDNCISIQFIENENSSNNSNNNLIAVTGETGSGKSLLLARVVELITGQRKASSTLVTKSSSTSTTTVQIELILNEPHLSATKHLMNKYQIDCTELENTRKLILARSISTTIQQKQQQSDVHGRNNDNDKKKKMSSRIKSTCQINRQNVPLKILHMISSTLLTVVDAASASIALSKPISRMDVIDTAISKTLIQTVQQDRQKYRQARKERQRLEQELNNRILPRNFIVSNNDDDDDNDSNIQLLQHWIEELDVFEKRVTKFCQTVANLSSNTESYSTSSQSELDQLATRLAKVKWRESTTNNNYNNISTMYETLSDFRDGLKRLDAQLQTGQNAIDALSMLSAPNSAAAAIEKARSFLFDTTESTTTTNSDNKSSSSSKFVKAAEHSHELLNQVEIALQACTRFIEEDERGLMRTLETQREQYPISVENIDEILMDWSSLARKHGITPTSLPSCHSALKSELDGNVEAKTLLPRAIEKEEKALINFQNSCTKLSDARREVANTLTSSVNARLPSLGMEGSIFCVELNANARKCTDPSSYSSGSVLGTDTVDFILLHQEETSTYSTNNNSNNNHKRGGSIHEVASSGEKARILLAIECALPGSVGAACSGRSTNGLPPVAVLYDEIDAHVGGRAAVSMASMLADQSRSSQQVIAITHSPSIAAVADTHVVIQRVAGKASRMVLANVVDREARKKELARMASGDLVMEEAEVFADALIREGLEKRNSFDI